MVTITMMMVMLFSRPSRPLPWQRAEAAPGISLLSIIAFAIELQITCCWILTTSMGLRSRGGKSWGSTKGPTIPDHKRPDEASAQTISSRIHHSIVSPLSGKEKHTKYDSRRYGCSLRDLTYWQGHKHRMWQSSWGRLLQGGWACGVSHHSIEQTNLNHLWYLDHRHLQIQNFDSLILFNIGWFWERDTPVCRPL